MGCQQQARISALSAGYPNAELLGLGLMPAIRAAPKKCRAFLSADRREFTFKIVGGSRKEIYPVERLDGWISLYRRLRDRNDRRYAYIYESTVEALEGVRRKLNGKEIDR
jgi:hypothetical protein